MDNIDQIIQLINWDTISTALLGPISLLIPLAVFILACKWINIKRSKAILYSVELDERRDHKLKVVKNWHKGQK